MVVWRKDFSYLPVIQALPIQAGDELQIRTRVPKGTFMTLYLINGRGQLSPLVQYAPSDAEREEVYPAEGRTSRLEGPPGTESVLAVGRRGGSVSDAEVLRLWEMGGDWPPLPVATVVLVEPDRVKLGGDILRDLGETRDRPEPAEQVRRRLEGLRSRLRAIGLICDEMAFGHP